MRFPHRVKYVEDGLEARSVTVLMWKPWGEQRLCDVVQFEPQGFMDPAITSNMAFIVHARNERVSDWNYGYVWCCGIVGPTPNRSFLAGTGPWAVKELTDCGVNYRTII